MHPHAMRFLLLIVILAVSASSLAADVNQLKKLAAMGECKGCDLTGAALPYGSFKNADLSAAANRHFACQRHSP